MPGKNKNNGGKGGKALKKLDSLTLAYVKVIQTSKQIKNLKSSMAPVVMREILDGFDENQKIYTDHKPYFFLGRTGPTQCVEAGKLKKEFNLPDVNNLEYDLDFLTVKNEKDRVSGLYFPDTLGRKFPESEKKEHEKIRMTGTDDASIQDTMHSEICDEHSHKFLSIILKNTAKLTAGLNTFTGSAKLKGHGSVLNEIKTTILALDKPKNGFKDENESFEIIPTSDYTIHVIGTKHSIRRAKFALDIKKRLVVATFKDRNSNESSKGRHIPIVEEISIQVKFPDESNIKGMPSFVNHEDIFVIYCALGHHDKATLGDANLHYFGDNAFSVHFDIDETKRTQDKTKTCLHLAGNVMKKIIDINSTNSDKMKSSIKFFSEMFDEKMQEGGKNINLKDVLNLRAEPTPGDTAAKLWNEITTEVQDPAKPQSKIFHPSSATAVYAVLHSFLKRQNIRGLLEVNAGRGCNIEKWISSSTFSVLSLSSYKAPHKKYVFVLTYIGQPKRKIESANILRPLGASMQSQFTPQDPNKTSVGINRRATAQSSEIVGRSLLSPDLEEELGILFR